MTKKEIALTKAQYALEIGKAYRRGLTEGVLAERNGYSDFVNSKMIPESLWESEGIRR